MKIQRERDLTGMVRWLWFFIAVSDTLAIRVRFVFFTFEWRAGVVTGWRF
jgi:hypothetical protein